MAKGICSVAGCRDAAFRGGLCSRHYHHWRAYGDPEGTGTPAKCCTVEGCAQPQFARGWCRKHMQRWRRRGTTDDPKPRTKAERFWAKVDKSGGPDACWPWLGGKNIRTGYGTFDQELAHRAAYELALGPIPAGLHLDHVRDRGCLRRDCVNPRHLEPVTPQENNRRSTSPSAINAAKTHCNKGHPLDGDNLYLPPGGRRCCRECRREATRRYRAEKKSSE